MAEVIRVYGKADSYDIEFTPNGDKWEVDVPPDMTDGVYAVQLTAIDELGDYAYWVGELYMVGGVCHLKINELPYRVRTKPKGYETEFHKHKYYFSCRSSSFAVDFNKKYSVQVKKRKQSNSNYVTEFATRLKLSEAVTGYTLTVATKDVQAKQKTKFHTKYKFETEISIRKGCHCYGG